MPEVNVLIPSLLRPVTGGQEELRLDVEAAGATLADLLDAIGAQYPVFNRRVRDETGSLRRFVNIYLDGDDVPRLDGLKTRVAAGSEVMVMQSVAGG
jgi:molybdopterin converting factor small subunit